MLHPGRGPSDIPVLELPSVDLIPAKDENYQYAGTYDRFDSEGIWHALIHARDRKGNTSVSEPLEISFGNPPKSRAVIVAGVSCMTGPLRIM